MKTEESKEIGEVNVVPLADVSLVLLILLLVLSPMMTPAALRIQTAAKSDEAPGEAPKEPAPAQEDAEPVLTVVLTPEAISVGRQDFAALGDFMAFITLEIQNRKDKKVFLAPHPDTAHGRVVLLLETLKDCGAGEVALVQTQEESPR